MLDIVINVIETIFYIYYTIILMKIKTTLNIQQEMFNDKVRSFIFTFLIAYFTVDY